MKEAMLAAHSTRGAISRPSLSEREENHTMIKKESMDGVRPWRPFFPSSLHRLFIRGVVVRAAELARLEEEKSAALEAIGEAQRAAATAAREYEQVPPLVTSYTPLLSMGFPDSVLCFLNPSQSLFRFLHPCTLCIPSSPSCRLSIPRLPRSPTPSWSGFSYASLASDFS